MEIKLKHIPIEQIEPWKEANARKTDILLDIEELASNIEQIGLQNPIVVWEEVPNKKYRIISGQRRWFACRKIGLSPVPCIVRDKITETQAMIASLSENLYRRSMNPEDVSAACEQLMKELGSAEKVAKTLGVRVPTVAKYLGYAKVPDNIKEFVRKKKLTPQQATNIFVQFPDPEHAYKIAKKTSMIKSRKEKRQIAEAIKISSPRDEFPLIYERAKRIGEMKEYIIHLPPRTSTIVEKAAKDSGVNSEDIIVEVVEKWAEAFEHGGA